MSQRSITALIALFLAVNAQAATAAPAHFHGVNWDREIARPKGVTLPPPAEEMGAAGVDTVRIAFRWPEMQAAAGAAIDFTATDAIVTAAARGRIGLLPVVMSTPGWAQKYPGRPGSPPRDTREYAGFLGQVVARYGHEGAFWLQHPELPQRPLRHWQIWNEPELPAFWNEPKFWVGYTKLVRASDRALERVDPRARLVLAGFTGYSWRSLAHLYDRGVKGHYDVAAIHPYTGSADLVAEVVRRNRRVLSRRGDPRKSLWMTELSWPAAEGRMKPPSGLRRVVTDDRGMARRLTRAYRYFADPRDRHHRVGRIYWYTWASKYEGRDDVFDYAGLLRFDDGRVERKPAFYAFKRIAGSATGPG